MTRKELYNEIVKHNLQETIKKAMGKNYTNCSSVELEKFVLNTKLKPTTKKVSKKETISKLDKLVAILAKKHILLSSEVVDIMNS